MNTFIAFLRGINVSGHTKVPMAALRDVCTTLGFEEIETYIQSGNIVFKSKLDTCISLEQLLQVGIQKEFGFDLPVLVKTVQQVKEIVNRNPFMEKDDLTGNKIYFVLLNSVPNEELSKKLNRETFVNEEFELTENCIYLKCNMGYGKAKLNNNVIERKLKVLATTRNYRTMNKLLELAKTGNRA